MWTRTYGTVGADHGVAGQAYQGGSLLTGSVSVGPWGGYDIVLIRLDSYGNELWTKYYGTPEWDLAHAMVSLDDGALVVGESYGSGLLQGSGLVLRVDTDGDTLWTRTILVGGATKCHGACRAQDGGFYLVGERTDPQDDLDAFITKMDQSGALEWTYVFDGDSTDVLRSVVQNTSGALVAIGGTASDGPVEQILLLSLNDQGQFLWQQLIGNTADASGSEVRLAPGSGYVFTGYNTLNLGERDMILTTTDAGGGFLLGNNFGDGSPADGLSVDTVSGGGFVVAGWLEGQGPGVRAMYVVRTDANGQTASLDVEPYIDPLPVPEGASSSIGLHLFPNPARSGDAITVRMSGRIIGPWTGALLDQQGRSVALWPAVAVEEPLVLPPLAPGTYVLQLDRVDGGRMSTRLCILP